ncbi:MAG TPA: RiPP maturation radical SAM C-methyltransferase [Blastocatellia bacterium]|nr:RiPP maturation radical SAM C-methyltransferase [Blastocatellia bacterium]
MFRISLINMPFADLQLPSIALTQIKSLIQSQFPGEVSIDIATLTHDFAGHVGLESYQYISTSMQSFYAGLGDWFFRLEAFPQLPDNTQPYLQRYFWGKSEDEQRLKDLIAKKRPSLGAYLDELITRYELDQARIVGFTSMFMQNAAIFAMARRLKQRNPEVVIVMGGANCEYPMGRVIAERIQPIDFVFSGPALKNFPEFVRYCLDGEMSKCASIRGVFSRGASPPVSGPETIGEELSIDTPIELNYDDFIQRFNEYFAGTGLKPILPFETSRGCWWGQRSHCTFCGLNGNSMVYRAMNSELALRQFKSLFQYSGAVHKLEAVDNILPKNYLKEVLPFLQTPSDMQIFYEVKADLSAEDVAILAKANVKLIQPGIESLATSTLKLMKKGTNAFQNVNLLKMCVRHEISPVWNLLVGFPGEDPEVYPRYLQIIPLLTHLEPPSGIYPVRFDRFSPYYNQAQSYKLNLHPMDFYSYIYPFDEAALRDFAYYFADRNLPADYFTAMVKWIGQLQAAVNQWRELWKDSSQRLPPKLDFIGDSDLIYDSRSGSATEYSVGPAGRALLNYLSKPARIDDLTQVFSDKDGRDLDRRLADLREKGLLFEEGDRLMSLVLGGERKTPAPASS